MDLKNFAAASLSGYQRNSSTVEFVDHAYDGRRVVSAGRGFVVQLVPTVVFGSWQDFDWHSASRGPSAIAELFVSITPPPVGKRSIVMNVSVCACVFVCHQAYLWKNTPELHRTFLPTAYVPGSGCLRRRCDTLCTSGFRDDVVFAHES